MLKIACIKESLNLLAYDDCLYSLNAFGPQFSKILKHST